MPQHNENTQMGCVSAQRMAIAAREDPATRTGALRRVGEHLGVLSLAERKLIVLQAEVDRPSYWILRSGLSTSTGHEWSVAAPEFRASSAAMSRAQASISAQSR